MSGKRFLLFSIVSLQSATSRNGIFSICILPDCISFISSTLFARESSADADFSIFSTFSSTFAVSAGLLSMMCAIPRIPLMGVRISCDILCRICARAAAIFPSASSLEISCIAFLFLCCKCPMTQILAIKPNRTTISLSLLIGSK